MTTGLAARAAVAGVLSSGEIAFTAVLSPLGRNFLYECRPRPAAHRVARETTLTATRPCRSQNYSPET